VRAHRGKREMQRDVDSDLGKWLLCKLMVKQGYSQIDIAEHMKKNENLERTHPNLDEDTTQDIEASHAGEVALSCP
jgi:hypothetical protein